MRMTALPEALPRAQPVRPELARGVHRLAWGDVSFEVDAATGGRVTALRLGGHNLLTGPEVDAGNYGSTFWTSPQTGWGWPPVPEIDHGRYDAQIEGDAIVMRSAVSAALGVDVEKRFSADRARGAILLDFRVRNRSSAAVALAPWQVTRVAPGGVTFFPTGAGTFPPSNLAVREAHGITWYVYDAAAVTDHQKLFADGREGWIAHVDGSLPDALLVKRFDPVPRARQAPAEAQIEIYANPGHTYVEVEVQGGHEILPSGGVLPWRVVWLVRRLPPALVPATVGEPLVAHVRALVTADARNAG